MKRTIKSDSKELLTKKLNKRKNPIILRSVLFLVFLLLIAVSSYLWFSKNKNFQKNSYSTDQEEILNPKSTRNVEEKVELMTYENEDFGFTVDYPADITLNQIGEHGDYLDFIRFIEYENSKSKGIMVGIDETTLDKEVIKVKKDIENEETAVLFKEQDMNVYGLKAKGFIYKPVNNADLEERAIVVIQKGKYVFSISTVPEQIDQIVSSMTFFEPTPGAEK